MLLLFSTAQGIYGGSPFINRPAHAYSRDSTNKPVMSRNIPGSSGRKSRTTPNPSSTHPTNTWKAIFSSLFVGCVLCGFDPVQIRMRASLSVGRI